MGFESLPAVYATSGGIYRHLNRRFRGAVSRF
jgi:hypothetical protein